MGKISYHSALFQIILVGLICFCCPGMFNVLNSIGGGGLVEKNVSANANVALNVTFSIFGVLGGAFVNTFGAKWSVAISGLGYAFYSASFLIFNATEAGWVVILAGALLGICAGILWTAQGQIMMSYATENNKGKYISLFWIIFNMGPVIGNIIPFALNFHNQSAKLSNSTYIGLIVVMLIGCAIALFLCPIDKVIREDGTAVHVTPYENVFSEAVEVLKVFTNMRMLSLIPLFVASNFFYAYQWEIINQLIFNLRTRSFNNIWYWAAQMGGAYLMGYILDMSRYKRYKRGYLGLAFLTIIFTAVWAGALALQLQFTRTDNPYMKPRFEGDTNPGVDFTSSSYGGPLVLYILFGALDAMLQTLAYWIMGSLSGDARVLTRYAGFYKGIQSAGAAVAWAIIPLPEISLVVQLVICWVLLEISVPGAFFAIRSITDTDEEGVSKDDIDLEAKA